MHPSLNRIQLSLAFFSFFLASLTFVACEMRLQIPSSTNAPDIAAYEFEATGEDFLISALDEVQAIADWSESFRNGPSERLSDNTSAEKKALLTVTSTDTVYIYGQVIPGGYGAVVTEKYARPKGLLLITVRKTYGKGNGHIVTETKRYASYADHRNDNPQQTNVTEMYGTQSDTIVTHVLRNGTLQTYTFRLPVVTRVVNPQDGSIRVTSRYASNGEIVSKITDGDGNLVQLRRTSGLSDGSSVSRTEYPDGSWRQVRTHGEADGTVTRETTSGLPTLGSGSGPIPTNLPRPSIGYCMPGQACGAGIDSKYAAFSLPRSGTAAPLPMPRPAMPRKPIYAPSQSVSVLSTRAVVTSTVNRAEHIGFLASGAGPAPIGPRPTIAHSTSNRLRSESRFASGAAASYPKPPPPCPSISSWMLERVSGTIIHWRAVASRSLCSGVAAPGNIPRPAPVARVAHSQVRPPLQSSRETTLKPGALASGVASFPLPPRPVLADNSLNLPQAENLIASGVVPGCPKPPVRPINSRSSRAVEIAADPATIRCLPIEGRSFCSGCGCPTPRPPLPMPV